jgi:hypothetical protein
VVAFPSLFSIQSIENETLCCLFHFSEAPTATACICSLLSSLKSRSKPACKTFLFQPPSLLCSLSKPHAIRELYGVAFLAWINFPLHYFLRLFFFEALSRPWCRRVIDFPMFSTLQTACDYRWFLLGLV